MTTTGGPGPVLESAVVEHPVLQRLRVEGSLGSRVRRGMAWTALTRLILQVLTFSSQIVLARLLLPEDFGLVALVLVLNGFATMLTELGLAAAVVQSRRVTDRLLTTAFWLNVVSGLVIAGVLVAGAPAVGAFYDDPAVIPLVQISALSFVLNVNSVPLALLQRSMRFRTTGALEVAVTVVGLAVTLVMAFAGAGAVSLVVGPVVGVVARTVLVWATVRWVPRGFVHRAELRELWRFGGGLTGANLLYFVSRNADTVLLGRFVGAAQLGLYSRSYTLMMMPLQQITAVLITVLLPAYAEMQDDVQRLRRAWTTAVRMSLLIGLPLGLGVTATAPALVETLYGERWLGMVTTLTLLAASVPPQLIQRNFGSLFQAVGRTGLQFRLAAVTTVMTLAAILVGLPWGITGVALALLVNACVMLVPPLVYVMRILQLSTAALVRALAGLFLAGGAMVGAALVAATFVTGSPAPVVLTVQVAAGGAAYVAVLCLVEMPLVRDTAARLVRRRRARGA